MHPKTVARHAALQALVSMERDGAMLSGALGAALRSVAVPDSTRAFARELVSGSLRHLSWIDWTLEPLLKTSLDKLDAPVRAALRLAVYERAWLHIPASAVANEYAGLMRVARLSSATGFVNAVARRLPSEPRVLPDNWPESRKIAVEFSHPLWLVERWLARFGSDECAALCRANNQIAPLSLRVNTLRVEREAALTLLQARDLKARSGELSPDAILIEEAGAPDDWPEWKAGQIIAQDEAAQLVSLLAAPAPGSVVIDCAAAPGGKTTHLAQLMGDEGLIIACDAAPGRVKLVIDNARRLGLSSIAARAGDLRALASALPQADCVLLDAPCSGTGTLRRRPDAKHRKTPEQLAELVDLQRELLASAALLVKPGGALVYATCSLEPEENEEQMLEFLRENGMWKIAADFGLLPAETIAQVATPAGFIQTLPHRHGCDGMFAAKLTRQF